MAGLLARCLRALGATCAFGAGAEAVPTLPGLGLVVAGDPDLARLLADADGRVGAPLAAPGVAWLAPDRLHLGSQPGGRATEVVVDDPAQLPTALAAWTLGEVHASVDYRLDLDLGAPAPAGVEPVGLATGTGPAYALDPALAQLEVVVLAGPGVVRAGQVEALRALAARTGWGVVNTWGAKGVFPWDSPAHLGTAGLQADDFALAGVLDAAVVIATGIDPAESPPARWAGHQVLEVEPDQLEVLTARWEPLDRRPARPPLYTRLAEALGPLYASPAVPLSPARAVADLVAARPPGALVAADAGPAGLWVARTFTTTEPASVAVPSRPAPGFALAAALVAALDRRPALAVTTDPLDPASAELLALAEHWGAPVALEVWSGDASLPSADEHHDRLVAALAAPGPTTVLTPVDLDQTRVLVEVAGEVVAWPPDL